MSQSRLVRALLVPLIILAWLSVVLIAGWLLSHVLRALLILTLAVVISFAITPIVRLLSRRLPRALSIAAAYAAALVVVLAVLGLLVATAAAQIGQLVHNLPAYSKSAESLQPQLLRILAPFGMNETDLNSFRESAFGYLQGFGSRAAKDALEVVATFLNAVIDGVLVLMLSIYLTASGPRLVRWLREQAPVSQRRRANLLFAIVNQVVGGYIRGTFTLAVLIGVLVGAGMGVLQVRYALLLGILAFFMEFVPILGVFISGAVCVLVALFNGWITALLVLGYFVVVHVIEGDLIGPRIMGKAVGIHPAVALLALVAGTELFGFWGALFGAPIAGLVQAIALAVYREIREVGAPELVETAVKEQTREVDQRGAEAERRAAEVEPEGGPAKESA